MVLALEGASQLIPRSGFCGVSEKEGHRLPAERLPGACSVAMEA